MRADARAGGGARAGLRCLRVPDRAARAAGVGGRQRGEPVAAALLGRRYDGRRLGAAVRGAGGPRASRGTVLPGARGPPVAGRPAGGPVPVRGPAVGRDRRPHRDHRGHGDDRGGARVSRRGELAGPRRGPQGNGRLPLGADRGRQRARLPDHLRLRPAGRRGLRCDRRAIRGPVPGRLALGGGRRTRGACRAA